MKKILSFCVAILAAMSMSAEITQMTCAEAAAAAAELEDKTPDTDTVAVTGYVTNTNGTISSGQQTFWMDDQKGTTKTFECYWGNLPQDAVDNNQPVNLGDKVTITGFLMRYGTTYEMKNPEVVILERAVVVVDTIEATVCEAIEEGESLNPGDNTQDIFRVTGVVSSVVSNNETYHNQNLYILCEDNGKTLQGYNIVVMDTGFCNVDDTILIEGKISKYNSQVQMNGRFWILGRAEVYIPDTFEVSVEEAVAAGLQLTPGFVSRDVYVVTGYVDSIMSAYSEEYGNISLFMCDDMENPTYDFEAYRCYVDYSMPLGSQVSVTGMLKYYHKDATDSTAAIDRVEIEKGNMEILSVPQYYIKHPFDGTNWEWREMEFDEDMGAYGLVATWGGVGCNINTAADDGDAMWFPESDIEFIDANIEDPAESPAIGTEVAFAYSYEDQAVVVIFSSATGIDDIKATDSVAQKVVRDNTVYVLRNGKMYTMQGQEVK